MIRCGRFSVCPNPTEYEYRQKNQDDPKGNTPWMAEKGEERAVFHSLWVRYPEACFGLVGVAASANEWTIDHSLALAATRIGKRDDDMIDGLIKCLGTCPEDIHETKIKGRAGKGAGEAPFPVAALIYYGVVTVTLSKVAVLKGLPDFPHTGRPT
jgi:hypothetical protein